MIRSCLYDPEVNRSYAAMAAHYDSVVLPTRPRRFRDKAKVEVCVLIVERWLLGRLRHSKALYLDFQPPFSLILGAAVDGIYGRLPDCICRYELAPPSRQYWATSWGAHPPVGQDRRHGTA